ncbi:MAG: cation:proton antiporter regulatory subunit [bacterium]
MSVFLLIIFIGISFLIVRVGAVAFRMTGLDWQRAKFQALSAFSGTGFTTKEAESIVNHLQRRKIATWLMILGNAGIVSVIATFVLTLRGGGVVRPSLNLALIALALFGLYKIASGQKFMKKLTQKIEQKLAEKTGLKKVAIEEILEETDGYGVARIIVDENFSEQGRTIAGSTLKEKDILILSIERNEEIHPNPESTMRLRIGDTLTCFGKLEAMRETVSKDNSTAEALSKL